MKTKTFKIGEYAKGGVITVEIMGKVITIIGKEWDATAGWKRSGSQRNAKEFIRGTALSTDMGAEREIDSFLNDLTTSYFADVIMEWIKQQVVLNY